MKKRMHTSIVFCLVMGVPRQISGCQSLRLIDFKCKEKKRKEVAPIRNWHRNRGYIAMRMGEEGKDQGKNESEWTGTLHPL
jgi:hypothetical protein